MRYWQLISAALYLGILIFDVAQAAALTVDPKQCGKACRQTFRTLRFEDAPEGVFFAVQECSSLLYQRSLYLCWDIHCTKDVWLAEVTSLNHTCQDINGSNFPDHDIVDGLTGQDIEQITRFNATSPARSQPVDVLVLPSQAWFDLWGRTLYAHDYIWDYHYYYGCAMGLFWAAVVSVGIINRVLAYGHIHQKRTQEHSDRTASWLKRNIITPATFGRRCVQDFGGWGTLPPRIQTLTLMMFVLLNITCCTHGYVIFEGYAYYPSRGMQVLRHVSDRTGIISFANFPLIWLFGMRNNLVIWFTGWDFKTYNNFHRWVGRIAALQAVIHSIGYTALIFQRGGWDYFWRMCNMTYWWTGELATLFMCLLVGLSVFWYRRRQYEIFLILHIILSILILIAMFYHVSIFKGDYDPLVWIPAIIWVLDRLLRGARIMAFNPRFWQANAFISYNENAHLVRLVVPVSQSLYKIQPGTFYYLTMLNKWEFWESHPFTVASASGITEHDAQSGENSPLLGEGPVFPSGTRNFSEKPHQEMTFLIRPYDNFTSRLKQYAQAEQRRPATLRVAIDGPYGKVLPLARFSRTVFIVGGSGIAVPLSYLKSLTASRQPALIEVHWAVRQAALAIDVLNHELSDILQNDRVKILIYWTGTASTSTSDEAIYRLAEWRHRRLDVEEIIDRALGSEKHSLAVVTSGPSRMADESRSAVTARMRSSSTHIEYFEESFQY